MKISLSRFSPSSSIYNSDPDSLDHYFRTSNLAALKLIFDSTPSTLNQKESKVLKKQLGWTPLFRSVMNGSLEISKFLLESGADPNIGNNLGETPLHQSCENNHLEITELLLQHGADINAIQTDGTSALHNAVRKGNYEIVRILVERGADTNLQEFLVLFI
jgi:ankyrin repeat protein